MARKPMTADTTIATNATAATDMTDMTDAVNTTAMTNTTPVAPLTFDPNSMKGVDESEEGMELKLGKCNFLNNPRPETKHGLFIPQESFGPAGWINPQVNYSHRYANGTQTEGILFNEENDPPRILILKQSPRFISVTQKGAEADRNGNQRNAAVIFDTYKEFFGVELPEIKNSQILGTTQTQKGAAFYDEMKNRGEGFLKLTTFYALMFVDQMNNPLHQFPHKFSVSGVPAVHWGNAVDNLLRQATLVFGMKYGRKLPSNYYSMVVFEPRIVGKLSGGDRGQSLACQVESFTPITKANFESMFAACNPEVQDHILALNTLTEGFTQKALAGYQADGFHELAPGVEAIDVTALPTASYETDED